MEEPLTSDNKQDGRGDLGIGVHLTLVPARVTWPRAFDVQRPLVRVRRVQYLEKMGADSKVTAKKLPWIRLQENSNPSNILSHRCALRAQ